jgi:hypothetical protein
MNTSGSLVRYRSLRILASLVILWTVASTALAAGVVGIDRILVTVSGLDRAEGFYRDGLGFETIGRGEMAGAGFGDFIVRTPDRVRHDKPLLTMPAGRSTAALIASWFMAEHVPKRPPRRPKCTTLRKVRRGLPAVRDREP